MRDPLRVRVSGRLERFVAGFVAELGDRGFARVSVVAQVQLAAHLSRWMAAERVAPAELTRDVIERFVESRRAAGYRHLLTAGALSHLLGYLRALGVAPVPCAVSTAAPADLLLERYRGYLVGWRGLAPATTRASRGRFSALCPRRRASWTWPG
jgi:hypothetical protein